ncbi:hypothetical protein EJ06DRAFT_567858 [Trichodelitschia bisporula]|uniref:BHLH domain-containing protein n=1 Tax=Trichodelitschia bisporula TaxID=703511 RepID=A0A6G1I7Q4_9PEZI|nr:hypothetical protein EJ06DRAFT_567858 [Trichodelitschia bisporula]
MTKVNSPNWDMPAFDYDNAWSPVQQEPWDAPTLNNDWWQQPSTASPVELSLATPTSPWDFLQLPTSFDADTILEDLKQEPLPQQQPIYSTSYPSTAPSTASSASTPEPHSPPSVVAPPKRRRGRPRSERSSDSLGPHDAGAIRKSTASSTAASAARRIPHNQVERKYREGINQEMERLRHALPSLAAGGPVGVVDNASGPRASKATVLASATEYIMTLEEEIHTLLAENEALRRAGSGVDFGAVERRFKGVRGMSGFPRTGSLQA